MCNVWNKYLNTNIFTREILYPSFISKKVWRSPWQRFFETSTFSTFSLFLTVNEVCNIQINANFLINKLKKYFYKRHLPSFQKMLRSPSQKVLETSTFYHEFYNFRTMNNTRSHGSSKDPNLFVSKGENLWNQYWSHRVKEKDYQISWKIKCNIKKFSKMEKLVKVFTLKTICKISLINHQNITIENYKFLCTSNVTNHLPS